MTDAAQPDVAGLVDRIARLEANVEALQDQVHRQSERHQHEMAELRRQLRPEELARSLSDDARRRGI
jgi:uncharacterized membrane protein YgaE (UPF0421/DUF939 family)